MEHKWSFESLLWKAKKGISYGQMNDHKYKLVEPTLNATVQSLEQPNDRNTAFNQWGKLVLGVILFPAIKPMIWTAHMCLALILIKLHQLTAYANILQALFQ